MLMGMNREVNQWRGGGHNIIRATLDTYTAAAGKRGLNWNEPFLPTYTLDTLEKKDYTLVNKGPDVNWMMEVNKMLVTRRELWCFLFIGEDKDWD